MLPAKTVSPTLLSIGLDSPVKKSSLVEELPVFMTPSIGIISPGEIPIKSPVFKSETFVITILSSDRTFAF